MFGGFLPDPFFKSVKSEFYKYDCIYNVSVQWKVNVKIKDFTIYNRLYGRLYFQETPGMIKHTSPRL